MKEASWALQIEQECHVKCDNGTVRLGDAGEAAGDRGLIGQQDRSALRPHGSTGGVYRRAGQLQHAHCGA